MLSLFIRNLFFTVLCPGIVAGFAPYLILGRRFNEAWKSSFTAFQYLAIFIFALGMVILLYCIGMFAIKGKGTLAPVDPTKKLVVAGLYKFTRNPMYIGVMLMLIGESIFFRSGGLLIYAILVFTLFNLFIIVHEEPRLRSDFGAEYQEYMSRVRRWL